MGSTSKLGIAGVSVALTLVALSCPTCPTSGGPCVDSSECPEDQVCVQERCRTVCNSSVACEQGEACIEGACLPYSGGGADGGGADSGSANDAAAGEDAAAADAVGADASSQDISVPDPCAGDPCAAPTACRADGSGGYTCVCGERACVPGEQCIAPVPVDVITSPRCCPVDWMNCADVCRDVRVDPGHCGDCGRPCAGGETCEDSSCRCAAQACDPLTQDCCEGVCYDVLTDPTHCGQVGTGEGCVQACGRDQICTQGRCSCSIAADCPASRDCCDASFCADLAIDVDNCGACGETCAPGEVCEASRCVCADGCDDGEACTEDSCVDGRCQHVTLDQDDDGYCHSSCPDSASGAVGDCIDGDCDDTDPALRPSAVELCDGQDNDCDAATLDGAADCPGLCCGEPATCSACCDDATVCGTGEWSCAAGACACDGAACGAICSSTAECCEGSDCGSGDWDCAQLLCTCDGAICGEHCYASGACCDVPNACGGCATLSAAPGSPCGSCGSYQCDGVDAVVCSGDVALDGGWSSWSYSAWTPAGSCGQYVSCKQRETRDGTRSCTAPAPSCGGADCVGESTSTETRDTLDCGTVAGGWSDYSYGAWTSLGSCGQYVSCKQRESRDGTRTCTDPAPACGGSDCVGSSSTTETRDTLDCGTVNGGWSSYSYTSWSDTGSCGQYVACKQREERDGTRTCTSPAPACGGLDCGGSATITETRDTEDCGAVNGGWTDYTYTAWTDVGSCHQYTECRQRETRDGTRTCTDPAPACGGSSCTGETTTTETRHTEICGVGDDCGTTYCINNRFRHETCGDGGACGNSRIIETCDTNETCDTISGCLCGNSGENCAGTSADFCCLNNTDGCYDVDTNNNHCGTGCAVCGVHSSCASGACSCDSDWGDCDPGTAGCETDLTTQTNCGSCGNDCIGDIDGEACVDPGSWRCGCEEDWDCPGHNFICYQQFNFCEPDEPY